MAATNFAWLAGLRGQGADREAWLERLHDLLRRAALAEARRRSDTLPDAVLADIDDLAIEAADDALVTILAKLPSYAGRSRFTTWAYKFALFEMSTRLRRHAWRHRPLHLDDDSWQSMPDGRSSDDHASLEHRQLLAHLGRLVDERLTDHQRTVFVAAALNDTPIDVLAERLGLTRNAVYKTLHDARQVLRAQLAADGYQELPR